MSDAKRGSWAWESHGEGWALYYGRDNEHHGANVLTVGAYGFDRNGDNTRKHIARAMNSHDALVETCRSAQRWLDLYGDTEGDCVALKEQIADALRLAGVDP